MTFSQATDAVAAYEALDRKSFQGCLIHILGAVNRKGNTQIKADQGRKEALKEDKYAKRKAMAGKEFNWSMLYMNVRFHSSINFSFTRLTLPFLEQRDAVASSIANRLNIDKSSILNPESGDNAAVKLALAETHIIQETKTYLKSEGVLLSSFSSRAR